MKSDVFWSLFAMPIGVTLCFGPAILAWLLAGFEATPGEASSTDKKAKH